MFVCVVINSNQMLYNNTCNIATFGFKLVENSVGVGGGGGGGGGMSMRMIPIESLLIYLLYSYLYYSRHYSNQC